MVHVSLEDSELDVENNESFLSLQPLIFSGVVVFQYTGNQLAKEQASCKALVPVVVRA